MELRKAKKEDVLSKRRNIVVDDQDEETPASPDSSSACSAPLAASASALKLGDVADIVRALEDGSADVATAVRHPPKTPAAGRTKQPRLTLFCCF